jgi:molecular chaperone GrpE
MSEKTEENTVKPEETRAAAPEGEAQAGAAAAGTPETPRAESPAEDGRELKIAELEKAKKALEEENLALKDQYLRTKADTDNFRKRLLREKQESIQFANRQLLEDLLPLLDDFERAIKSAEAAKDFTAFHDGIIMIQKQFADLLDRKWGLKRFVSVGEEFDPQRHEALYSESRPGERSSIVLEDYMTGYTLHDKVLRAAKVKISLPGTDENRNKEEGPPENPEEATH